MNAGSLPGCPGRPLRTSCSPPFSSFYFDGNKRTARCQMNRYLMSHGFDAIRVRPIAATAIAEDGGQ
jgi:hypothetical protein